MRYTPGRKKGSHQPKIRVEFTGKVDEMVSARAIILLHLVLGQSEDGSRVTDLDQNLLVLGEFSLAPAPPGACRPQRVFISFS